MERKFRTLNGKIATESELREYYGDEFDRRMNNGEFKQVADDEQLGTREEVGEDTELYITPNGMEVEGQELKDFYGLDDFNKRVNEGQIKKKKQWRHFRGKFRIFYRWDVKYHFRIRTS